MSPDVEWSIGEDAEREIIVRTSPVRRSRRSLWTVILAIGLGVSLGVIYRSIPEPPARPIAPTAIPTVVHAPALPAPTHEPLETAIQRDAVQLATLDGKREHKVVFDPALGRMPQAYADWYAALQNAYGSWGTTNPRALVAVFETGTLPNGVAWADVGQMRNDDFYRHTRFYRLQDNHWIWTLPDQSFWETTTSLVSTDETSPIGPLTIEHASEETHLIDAVFERFTRAYLNLCQRLKCPPPAAMTHMWTPGLTLTLTLQPLFTQPIAREESGTLYIDLPSPRVVGYYEDARSLGDPYTAMAYATLIEPIVRLASGNYARWENDRGGELFLHVITNWKRARVFREIHPLELFYPPIVLPPASTRLANGWPISQRDRYVAVLRGETLLPLDAIWNWDHNERAFGLLQHVAANEAQSVVIFIEDRYGESGVVRFLNVLGQAHSLVEAIETALPVHYAEFNRQWKEWIAGD
ncbi:MAG TPA: hypothetical protein VLG46_01715 [Anaerolineae bacterium]|nr:hypothetical protein [Anaerolineae bacterium]